MRQQAEKWGINPKRVGIMGFSAGAVVATRIGVRHDADSRPDFVGAIYGAPMQEFTVPADAPPLFVLFAKDDGIGVQATELHKKWKDAGKPAELVTLRERRSRLRNEQTRPTDRRLDRAVLEMAGCARYWPVVFALLIARFSAKFRLVIMFPTRLRGRERNEK